ncbi:MAG TPA: hypothetical protein VKE92_08665 [Anaerolineales bacterium]|nr:hypothetical protein [Anaerolineales bacterium]
MNCFYHPGVASVAICTYCQKGLCTECAVDLKQGIACKQHQAEVNELYDIHFMHKQPAQNTSRVYKQSAVAIGIACIFLAIAFSVYANRMKKEKNRWRVS